MALRSLFVTLSQKTLGQDVVYRVHMGLPLYNKFMEPLVLSARQEDEFRARPFVDLGGEFPFPGDILLKNANAESKGPLMTFVLCLKERIA